MSKSIRRHTQGIILCLLLVSLAVLACASASAAATKPEGAAAVMERELAEIQQLEQRIVAHIKQNQFAQARPLIERLLPKLEKIHGRDHETTVKTRDALATICLALGDFTASQKAYTQALASRERSLGKNHPETVRTRQRLALAQEAVKRAQAKSPAAKPEGAAAVTEREVAELAQLSQRMLAHVEQKQFAQARPLIERALPKLEKIYGRDHETTVKTRDVLATICLALGDFTASQKAYTQALASRERSLGKNHPETVRTRQRLALAREAVKRAQAKSSASERPPKADPQPQRQLGIEEIEARARADAALEKLQGKELTADNKNISLFLGEEFKAALAKPDTGASSALRDFMKTLPEETRRHGEEILSFFTQMDPTALSYNQASLSAGAWMNKFALDNILARESLGRGPERAFLEEGRLFREGIRRILQIRDEGDMVTFMSVFDSVWSDRTPLEKTAKPGQASLIIQTPVWKDAGFNPRIDKPIFATRLSPDGHLLAVNYKKILVVYEVRSGRELWRKTRGDQNGRLLRFLNNHSLLVSTFDLNQGSSLSSALEILDSRNGRPLHRFITTGALPGLTVFGENGDLLAIGDGLRYFAVLNTRTPALLEQFALHDCYVFTKEPAEVLHKKAEQTFLARRKALVRKYSLRRDALYGDNLKELIAARERAEHLEVGKDGKLYAAGGTLPKALPLVIPGPDGPLHLSKSDARLDQDLIAGGACNNEWIYIEDAHGMLHLFSLKQARYMGSAKIPDFYGKFWCLSDIFRQGTDDRLLCRFTEIEYSGKDDLYGLHKKHWLAYWDLAAGRIVAHARLGAAFNDSVSAFALAPSDTAFVATRSGVNRFMNFADGRVWDAVPTPGDAVVSARYSADGAILATATARGRIMILRGEDSPPQIVESGLPGIRQVAVDAQGERVWVLHDAAARPASSKKNDPAPEKSPAALSLVSFVRGTVSACPLALAPESMLDFDPDSDSAVLVELTDKPGKAKKAKPQSRRWKEGGALVISLPQPAQYGVVLTAPRELLGWSAKKNAAVFQEHPRTSDWTAKRNAVLYPEGTPPHTTDTTGGWITLFMQSSVSGEASSLRRRRFSSSKSLEMNRAFFHPGGKVAAVVERETSDSSFFYLCSLATGMELLRMGDPAKHPAGIADGAFLHKSTRMVTIGNDGVLRLWDYGGGTEPVNLISWIFLANGNYLAVDEAGRFDTPNLERMDGVHWITASHPGRTFPLDCFMRDYYQPRLAEYVLSGRALPPVGDLGGRNLFQHEVAITEIAPDPQTPGRVAVTVELSGRDGDRIQAAQDLKLFRDGRLVAKHPGDNGKDGVLHLAGGSLRHTFGNIPLPAENGQVSFTAYAFNTDKIRSQRARREYRYPVGRARPRLFLLSVGINEFDNPAWNLRYAVNDARAFSEILPRHLPAPGGTAVALLSSGGAAKPDKKNLRGLLLRLSGVSESGDPVPYAERSGPNDIVVLTVASHGLTANDSFYILPADIPGKGLAVTPDLLSRSISAEDLQAWLANLDAKEIVLVLDTCQSGAALGGEAFKPGPMGDRGLGQLAYDKAMRVLCATNENSAALEYGPLRHGLLTYALLREGLEKGEAAKPGAETSLRDWLAFGRKRATELYRRIAQGEDVGGGRGRLVLGDSKAALAGDRGKVLLSGDVAGDPAALPSGPAFSPALGQEPRLFDRGGASALLSLAPLPVAPPRMLSPPSDAPDSGLPDLPVYPPLSLAPDGKPLAKAHTVRVADGAVLLALQVLAPGREIAAVRVDNVGGISCLWRSDGKEGAKPLAIAGADAPGGGEGLLALSLTDNGAFAGKETDFRVTVFFTDGQRAMCLLSARQEER